MSIVANPSIVTEPPRENEEANATTSTIKLSEADLQELAKLPVDSLDTIRSKLVQLIDAITSFRSQLESSPLTPNTLSYPSLISKFLILLNHTEALSQALNTPFPARSINRFELPSVRAEREEHQKWEYGPGKQSVLGSLAAVPRGLEGLEDSKEWIIGVLTRTKLAPEIEKEEQDLISLLPPPPSVPSSDSNLTIELLLEHVKNLTKGHENHIANCRRALHKARYGQSSEHMDLDLSPDDGGNQDDTSPQYGWRMRVEVDDPLLKGPAPAVPVEEVTPSKNQLLKSLIRFMRDGTTPIDQLQTQESTQ